MVERYHAVLQRAYKVIAADLQEYGLNKETILQIAVEAINNTAGPNGLVPTFLVFEAYPHMSKYDSPTPTMTQRDAAIKNTMKEVQRVRAERQVIVSVVHDLLLNSEVLVLREGNAGHSEKWNGPFKLLVIDKETCKVQLPSGPTNFRITTVKPYLQENSNTQNLILHDSQDSESDLDQLCKENNKGNNEVDLDTPETPFQNPAHTHRLPSKFQHMADISILLQSDDSQPPFTESRRKKINGLLEKKAFGVVAISDISSGMRIFNSRFVDEIKNESTATAFEKLRLAV